MGYTLIRPDGLHVVNAQGCWDGGRPRAAAIPAAAPSQPERAPRGSGACASKALGIAAPTCAPPGGRSRRRSSVPPCPKCQSLMTFLAPSTAPVDFQGIVEVLPISSDRCVTHQAGSYKVKALPLCLHAFVRPDRNR